MAQFDIFTNNSSSGKSDVPLLMDLQSESVSVLDSDKMISKIHISIDVKNTGYIAFISEMAAIPISMFGSRVSNAGDNRTEITAAVDLLFTGF